MVIESPPGMRVSSSPPGIPFLAATGFFISADTFLLSIDWACIAFLFPFRANLPCPSPELIGPFLSSIGNGPTQLIPPSSSTWFLSNRLAESRFPIRSGVVVRPPPFRGAQLCQLFQVSLETVCEIGCHFCLGGDYSTPPPWADDCAKGFFFPPCPTVCQGRVPLGIGKMGESVLRIVFDVL